MRYLNQTLAMLAILTAASAFAVDYVPLENEDFSDAVQDEVAREQWSIMRDQPELNDTSGTQGTLSQFFELAFSKKKPSKAELKKKDKKADPKNESLDQGQGQAGKLLEPAADAKLKIPDAKTKVIIPADKNKAVSPDGSTKAAY